MFVLAVVFEGLRTLQEFLAYLAATLSKQTLTKNDSVIEMLPRKSCCSENEGDCNPPSARKPSKFLTWAEKLREIEKKAVLLYWVQSVIQVVRVGVAYLLMLAVMTFNGWLFLSIAFGSGVGYFAFGWMKFLFTRPKSANAGCSNGNCS